MHAQRTRIASGQLTSRVSRVVKTVFIDNTPWWRIPGIFLCPAATSHAEAGIET